ncbi:XRE family transcriptional regulator [Streptomyces phyllanthi]|uniref:XRE family transcriptional regulator n=1 Tax=Streptomyces phyllanthi TaxID=1803180 RepID=A0A5N8W2U0_9ACTN|nr:XRE family transcriptional regulator [Streptomyces phyllanthi]MPY41442.1 XRE family transcriptional regulator [Streptomyces phyllanthi]
MHDLARLLDDAMHRHHLSAEAVALATGIRTPRVRAFLEDGAAGPVHPTREELVELSRLLALPQTEVLEASRRRPSRPNRMRRDAVPG